VQFPQWPSGVLPQDEDPDLFMLGSDGQPTFEIAITFDGRSKPRQHFLSAMLVIKQSGLEEYWQKPGWIYTVCEVQGHDSADNMRKNIMPFWNEVQQLIDGKRVTAFSNGQNYDFQVIVRLPADMKAHWALFGCGGRRPNICHRCMVTYEELEIVLSNYVIRVRTK
jgi:hypothetical protein